MEARSVQIAEDAFRLRSYVMETTIVVTILTNHQKCAKTMCVMLVKSDATVVSVLVKGNIVTMEGCA
jgi:hypothetical protein